MRANLFRCLMAVGCAATVASCGESQTKTSKGMVDVAIVYTARPAMYRSDAGKPTGFLYDLELAAIRRAGLTPEVTPTSFENVITGVQSGKFDVGSGVDLTPVRADVVDIVPFYRGGYSFLVRDDDPKPLGNEMSSLCGLTIAVTAGGSDRPVLSKASDACRASGARPMTLLSFPSEATAMLAVKSGKADAMTAFDWYPAAPGMKLEGPTFSEMFTGIALKKGARLSPRLAAALNDMIADGSYQKILEAYGVPHVAIKHAAVNDGR